MGEILECRATHAHTHTQKEKLMIPWSFPGGSVVKNLPANAGDTGSIPGSGRAPGGGNGLQYSCLGSPMDMGAWQATVHGITKKLGATQ